MQNLDKIVDEARHHPKVDELYRKVNEASPIKLEERSDGYWSHGLVGGISTIGISPTQHPQESLFHELLHADLKNNGHKSHLGRAGDRELTIELGELLWPIDQELQHHRMFNRFVAAGFASEHFYSEADAQTFGALRGTLTTMPEGLPAALMLPQFLSVIAPGGAMPEAERQALRELIRSKSPSAFSQLEGVEGIMRRWATEAHVDPGPTVVAILRALGRYDGTWIGASPSDVPDGGYFIGRRFALA